MIDVLVIAVAVPGRPAAFAESIQRLKAAGASVTLFAGFAEGATDLPVQAGRGTAQARGFRHRGRGISGTVPSRIAALRRAAAQADVLVALDPPAVYTVWQLAQRHRATDAVIGLSPAIRRVEIRSTQGFRRPLRRVVLSGPSLEVIKQAVRGHARRYGRAVFIQATGARVQRTGLGRSAWQAALRAPLPTMARLPLARRVADGLTRAGYAEQAGSTVTAVARRLPQPRRARFLAESAEAELVAGRTPLVPERSRRGGAGHRRRRARVRPGEAGRRSRAAGRRADVPPGRAR